jgi:hypothetical protein
MSKPVSKAASGDSCGRSDLNGCRACWVWPYPVPIAPPKRNTLSTSGCLDAIKEGRKELSWLSLSRYVQQLLPGRATMTPLAAQ